ncbi:hypothetical protein A2U01_0040226, partial [Trifolium medium]|nr:hypothetical protein [Trifolium medium]
MLMAQNQHLAAVEESKATRLSRSSRPRRSATPEQSRSITRSRPPRPQRRNERPPSPRRHETLPRNSQRHENMPLRHSPRRNSPRRDSPPPRCNCRHSPAKEGRHRRPLSRRIMDVPSPVGMEKPSTMDTYDGSTDPDDHIENIEAILDYRGVQGSIKCKLFPITLRKGAMAWYKSFSPGSIDSWTELCRLFSAHFTA